VKFILKDGLIHIVGNHGLPNNNIEGTVVAPDLDGYDLAVSVNGGAYNKVDSKIRITKEDLKKAALQLTVRAIKDNNVFHFKSDVIPLTHAIIFGKTLEDSYPEVIKYLLKEMKELKEFVGYEMKHTKDELHEHMLELVDTFEEINKKGSLF